MPCCRGITGYERISRDMAGKYGKGTLDANFLQKIKSTFALSKLIDGAL